MIGQYYPEYGETFERLVHGKGTYFGNMMVCKKEIYDAYCQWLFDIFEKAERKIDASGYDDYHKRVYGFISEFLLYVWTQVQGLKVYECKVGMTDEKRETAAPSPVLYSRAGHVKLGRAFPRQTGGGSANLKKRGETVEPVCLAKRKLPRYNLAILTGGVNAIDANKKFAHCRL